jgi:hypothetical protein
MAENQQPPGEPPTPPTGLPALPAGTPPAPLPPGLDADEYRRFQEFQRFQDYQRFTRGQPGNLPAPAPHHHELATHLADMRQQLARIEKVTNPPTWQKVLRNKWLHRLAWLIVLIVLATWGVPTLIHHYFGNSDSGTGPAALPAPLGESGDLAAGPHQAVADIYMWIAQNQQENPCITFDNTAKVQFATANGIQVTANDAMGACKQAIAKLFGQVSDKNAYATPDLTQLPSPQGSRVVISSCSFAVSGGPRLGTFTLTQQNQGWEITKYAAGPTPCPASAPPTS